MSSQKPPPDLPSDDELVAIAEEWRQSKLNEGIDSFSGTTRDGDTFFGFAYPQSATEPVAWIKFSESMGEARMQAFAREQLSAMDLPTRGDLRVPEVYRAIERGGQVYVVMEYVPGKTLNTLSKMEEVDGELLDAMVGRVADAVRLLLSIPVPQDTPPGPKGGGLINHMLFKDHEAPIEYASLDELERHLNKVGYEFVLLSLGRALMI